MALTKITHSMSSTPGILDNSNATAITIGSDESVTLTGNMLHAGDFTLDVAGDIILDADGQDIRLKDAGTEWGRFTHTGHFGIQNPVSDADIQFIGNDDGSTITALTLDMSAAGAATFNAGVTATGLTVNTDADSSLSIADAGTNAILIKAAAGDELYMGANDTYAIRVLNDGTNDVVMDNGSNLGIGVSPKDWKTGWRVLNIGPEASFYSQANATAGIGENIYYNNSNDWVAVTTGPSSIYQLDSGTHNFYTMASVSAGATATPLQRMLIDNAGDTTLFGNLQIQKTGADSVIDVKGNSSHDAVLNLRSDQGGITTEGFQVWYNNSVGDVHLATTYNHDNASIRFHTRTGADKVATGVNERLTIHGNGNIEIPDGNLAFASGHGIDFSASTNYTSSSSELLDDYEEGLWYPYLGTETQLGSPASSNYNNFYVKVGRLVKCTGYFNQWNYANVTSGTYMMIRNLPFPPAHHDIGMRMGYASNIGSSNYAYGNAAVSGFYLMVGGTTGAPTHYLRSGAPASGAAYAMITVTYYTAS